MKLNNEQISEIMDMNLEQAYEFYTACLLENKKLKKYYDEIRFGIIVKFDIHHIFYDLISIKPKNHIARIDGSSISLSDYWTEVESRRARIKKAILDHVTEPNDIFKEMEE